MTGSSQPTGLTLYLADHGFAPACDGRAWLDRDTGHGIIWVICEPGGETQMISLTPAGVCQYKIVFSPGTPDAMIVAALDAGLRPPSRP